MRGHIDVGEIKMTKTQSLHQIALITSDVIIQEMGIHAFPWPQIENFLPS